MDYKLENKQYGENCVVCGQTKAAGLHLYTSFICTECERSMIRTETSDPNYKYFVHQLRKITKPEIYS
ncbi:sigma factor G inhibitor Gin [Bacillus massilinigeriensis]|uniref:sigma factor G inhibitor Gin n=1 Tax=Bacillus mediterraneensis TaxID=1805474 RepID=UPI0008F82AC2|nr:sigma factor G inhibitor Gin [Bacillus mediterraneensis]